VAASTVGPNAWVSRRSRAGSALRAESTGVTLVWHLATSRSYLHNPRRGLRQLHELSTAACVHGALSERSLGIRLNQEPPVLCSCSRIDFAPLNAAVVGAAGRSDTE